MSGIALHPWGGTLERVQGGGKGFIVVDHHWAGPGTPVVLRRRYDLDAVGRIVGGPVNVAAGDVITWHAPVMRGALGRFYRNLEEAADARGR